MATSTGTVMIKDILNDNLGSDPQWLTNVNGTLFFQAQDGTHGGELWKSDGTSAGTVLVKDIMNGRYGRCEFLTNMNGTLFFSAGDGTHAVELWKSDGTSEGTVMVRDIMEGVNGSTPRFLTNVNGTLFFNAFDGIGGDELWKSNGTWAGTVQVRDSLSGPFNVTKLTNVNGTLYFTADDRTNGLELWKSDGTAAGTVLVKDIRSGSDGSYPYGFTNVNGTLYFVANDGTRGEELWRSDGTTAGTVMIRDIGNGPESSNARYLTNVNGTLLFYAAGNSPGLWKSDGTTAGTVGLTNNGSSNARNLTNVNGTLYFSGDGNHGMELWRWINEAPTDIMPSSTSIAENAGADAPVGSLFTSDPDLEDTHSYTLVAGEGDTDNAAFNISGNILRATNSFDFETKSSYSIRIRSTDPGGLWTEKPLTITVTDVGEDVMISGLTGNDLIIADYTGNGSQHSWNVSRNGSSIFSGPILHGGRLVIDGLGGSDTLQITGRSVTDLFELAANQVAVNGGSVQFTNIETLKILGGDGDDELTVTATAPAGLSRSFDGGLGIDAVKALAGANTWNVTGAGIANLINPTNLAMTTIESLVGGSGNDQFVYAAAGSLTGKVLGGSGFDTISFAAKTTAHTVNLQSNTTTSTGGIGGIESFIGSNSAAVNDLFIGTDSDTDWTINGANAGMLSSVPTGTVTFSGFESLTGGAFADSFTFTNSGSLSKTLMGGTAIGIIDTLDLSARSGALDFRLNATSNSVPGTIGDYAGIEQITGNSVAGSKVTRVNNIATTWEVNASGQIVVGGVAYSGVGSISGNPGTLADTLNGPTAATIWTIDSANDGTLAFPGLTVSFTGIENIKGGTDVDILTGGLGQDWFFALASEITDLVTGGSTSDRRN